MSSEQRLEDRRRLHLTSISVYRIHDFNALNDTTTKRYLAIRNEAGDKHLASKCRRSCGQDLSQRKQEFLGREIPTYVVKLFLALYDEITRTFGYIYGTDSEVLRETSSQTPGNFREGSLWMR